MGSAGSFEDADRLAARNFGEAARASGGRRIGYLGGLGSSDDVLSAHLRSRHEVGEILRASGGPGVAGVRGHPDRHRFDHPADGEL